MNTRSIFCVFFVVISVILTNANPEPKPLLLDGLLDRLHEIVHDRVQKLRAIPQRLTKTLKTNLPENVDSVMNEDFESAREPSDMVMITIKSFRDKEIPIQQNENSSSSEYEEVSEVRNPRQIPIISDIVRVKKVVEFLEAVGEQVIPIIIQNITPQPQSSAGIVENDRENRFLKALENPVEENTINTTGNLDDTEDEF